MKTDKRYFYSLWFRIKGQEKVRLLDDEPTFLSKHKAFNRVNELTKENDFCNTIIYVRKIKVGSRKCIQWEFDCDEQ